MRAAQPMRVTLSDEMTDAMKSNEYAGERKVIRDEARDCAVERWLHNEVGPAWDALKADPSHAVSAGQVRARLAAERAKAR